MAWKIIGKHKILSLPRGQIDIILTFKEHCKKTKMKVEAKNNFIQELADSKWDAAPNTIRTTGLCFFAGEYTSPVWNQS